ncbi:hypothetical protein ACLBOM_03115 [Escherichia coli]
MRRAFFTQLKCRMMPYLYREAARANAWGTPMMRAMMMEFPDDPACDYLDRQYMLGDNVMVAPVFTEAGDVQFYLPEGRWTHLWHNDELDGSRWQETAAQLPGVCPFMRVITPDWRWATTINVPITCGTKARHSTSLICKTGMKPSVKCPLLTDR